MILPLSLAVSSTGKRALCLSLIIYQCFLPAAFAGGNSAALPLYGQENGPISDADNDSGADSGAGSIVGSGAASSIGSSAGLGAAAGHDASGARLRGTAGKGDSGSGALARDASERGFTAIGAAADTSTGGGAIRAPGALSGLGLSLPGENYILPSERILKGSVTASPANSPLLYGSVQTMPPGSKIDMTLQVNLNSELSQKGQEVFARISRDVTDASGNKVLLPGQWVAHGYVTEVAKQRRSLRNGYVEVKFDKIMSPDGQYEIPFDTKFTTRDNALKAAGKIFVKDAGYVALGAAAGSVLSVQLTGIPLAVASHGYSVAIGATAGGVYGIICGLKNKGKICSLYPGDQIKLTTAEPISLPGFNPLNLDSAKPVRHLRGLDFTVEKTKFGHEVVSDDGKARVLNVYFRVQNNTRYDFSPLNLRIVSDHGQTYTPHPGAVMMHLKHVQAGETRSMCVPFLVDSHKHKYWMVLHDLRGAEISRVLVN